MSSEVDIIIAALKQDIEKWRDEQIQQVRDEHSVQMQAILARAKADMQKALDEALRSYQQGLEDVRRQREELRAQDPQIVREMEEVFTEMEKSASKMFWVHVKFIKDMYRKGLGIQ